MCIRDRDSGCVDCKQAYVLSQTGLYVLFKFQCIHMKSNYNHSNLGTYISILQTDTTANPTWIEDYQKAIDKRGSVIVKVVRAIFSGSPEVGKSSLKYNLVYGKSKEVKISTGVAESPEVVIATNYLATGSVADWIPVDEEVMELSLIHI